MRLTDQLSLSFVPRWGIVPMLRLQSVSDHVFRVLNIFTELCERMSLSITAYDIMLVMQHDGPESHSGDIPTPFKHKIASIVTANERDFCSWYVEPSASSFSSQRVFDVFRAADLIEQYTWLRAWGHGPLARRVVVLIRQRVDTIAAIVGDGYVDAMIADIDDDEGRYGGRAQGSR